MIYINEDQTVLMKNATQWNEANRAIRIGNQYADCPASSRQNVPKDIQEEKNRR